MGKFCAEDWPDAGQIPIEHPQQPRVPVAQALR